MMGHKERVCAPLTNVSLEDLVPADHFYRHLERSLDLSFVRDLVVPYYAAGGRPSIDPVVFFKLQLVLFFEGLHSERQLMRVVADRLSARWYLGYDLGEALPDHSSLTKIRDRYGLDTFRRFFDAIVERCRDAGLVWGKELYVDATKVDANASLDSVCPRFAVEAHLQRLFDTERASDAPGEAAPAPDALPVPASPAVRDALAAENAARQDWLTAEGRPDRTIVRAHYQRLSDFKASRTDPDATLMQRKGGGAHFGYHDHYVVDGGKARIILQALVTPSDVMENQPLRDLVWHVRFRWKLRPAQATGDTTYGTIENIVALEDEGIRAYMPLPDMDARTELFGKREFRYDPTRNVYVCPQGQILSFNHHAYTVREIRYRAKPEVCNACPAKARCTTSDRGREVSRHFEEAYLERVRAYHETEAYQKARRKRQVWVEPLFAEAKDWHGLRRFRLRGLTKVNIEGVFTATGQNLKRLLSRRGWGHRPWPGGAAGLAVGVPNPAYPRVLLVYWSFLPSVSGQETPLAPIRPGIRGHVA